MDANKTIIRPNPREKSNWLSILFWTWTIKFFKTGYSKVLGPEDLFDPLSTDKSDILGDRLEKQWFKELANAKKKNRQPSFLRAIFRCFFREYFLLGCIQTFNELILRLGTPILLGGLLRYFRVNSGVDFNQALMFAGGICVAVGINAISINHAIFNAFHVGGKIRIAVCSVVYRKALRLSTTALGETAAGKVVNLVANDVNRFDLVSIFFHHMWLAPLLTLIIGYILYMEAGYAGICGIAAVFVVVPIQSYTGKLSSIFRLQTAIKTDERVRLMDEIISGVQVIKMYAWEKPFCALVELARRLELKVVTKSSRIRGIFMTFNLFTTRVALYCTIVGMIFMGPPLSAEKVFVFSALFGALAQNMSAMFVRGVAEIAECIVAVRRLQNLLMYDEFESGTNRTVSNFEGSLNDSKRKSSKYDVPFIDDDVTFQPNERQGQKHNGLALVASDLVKNTASVAATQRRSSKSKREIFAVKISNVTAKWEDGSAENTLDELDVEIEQGKLYVIIGAVGSGKSSLIAAILGEMSLAEGHVYIKGGISYAAQEAWVFGSTVRQNIIFGQPYDRQRYQRVIKACALPSDFKQFPQGDLTVVGERGSSLSGGQKARINLARAVYRQADIYIFDDPLSAVDTHVGKHLFEECMKKYLSGKTRILATHQLQYIKDVDAILLLEHGKLRKFNSYLDLLANCPEYSSLLSSDSANETGDESLSHERLGIRRQSSTTSNRSRTPDIGGGDTDIEDDDEDRENIDNLEGTSKGTITGIYMKYFRAGGNWCMIISVALLFILSQCAVTMNDIYFPRLVKIEENRYREFTEMKKFYEANLTGNSTVISKFGWEPAIDMVYIYSIIVFSIFVIGITRSLMFYSLAIGASQRLHDSAFGALIRTGMRFFDTNPSGRVLNRFSKDMGAIDELLPKALLDAAQINMMMVGSLVIICTVNYLFIVPLAIIFFIFYFIRKVYLRTSKNVKRLEGMLRSPVFTHLNATLHGLTTIRAYGAQKILKAEFDHFQDTHSSSWYMFISTSTAFGFSLDIFCFIFTVIVTFGLLFLAGSTGSEVGLAISTVMTMTGIIQWGMRQSAEVDNQMMSVERVLEYTLLPPEDNLCDSGINGKKKIKKSKDKVEQSTNFPVPSPKNWPSEGHIRFSHVYMRYADDEPPVLKGLDIVIKPREKIGIVGRTGAGKSSLISALFRLAKVDGIIEIDGVDTGTICLEDLRRHISIIPQDPVLFSGTLRRNLDPFNEFSDDALWAVLEEVELKDAVTNGMHGLDSRVFDRGTNFSAGQRQLICLARAILKDNRVLMLDEATANVDPQTDAFIQRTIRTKFAKCTVLTVAHRLNTIMDSDKVLVMDKGRMTEFDHPHILLQNQHGQFSSLVKETGRSMTEQLLRVAKDAYVQKYGDNS